MPDTELYALVKRFQNGDPDAGWQFVESTKIKAIIRGRLRQYKTMYAWLPVEDFEDVACSLRPRILEILSSFGLSDQPNDGRILSYFSLRIKGEADYLLKKLTGMKQVVDETTNQTYFKSLAQTIESAAEQLPVTEPVDGMVIDCLEDERQLAVFERYCGMISDKSNDRLWLRCYLLRLASKTWAQIAKEVNYKHNDYSYLNINTARFTTRLRDALLKMGESVSYRICGIYTDVSDIAYCVFDSTNPRKLLLWEKSYDSYEELDKAEAKLGDIFRQYEITYVVMNDEVSVSRASIVLMRYLSKREAFVEIAPLRLFNSLKPSMPTKFGGITLSDVKKSAYLLAQAKRAQVEFRRRKATGAK